MELLLLFTLTLGSFLMVMPYVSGDSVTMRMNSYSELGSVMRVECEFASDDQIWQVVLNQGGVETQASYSIGNSQFAIQNPDRITLEVRAGTTFKAGSITFVISRLACNDFTWYMCKAVGLGLPVYSSNETLQVNPTIEPIQKTSINNLVVHEISNFMCTGTVSKQGQFTILMYRRTITDTSQLPAEEPQVLNEDTCSRRVSTTVSYNVSEYDIPNLVLWCELSTEVKLSVMGNFTVEEMTTIAAPNAPQTVKASLDAGSIVGIVLGITATIVLVVLLVWFLVIRPKRLKEDGPSKDQGPEPNAKDYQVQDNVLYATVDPLKKVSGFFT